MSLRGWVAVAESPHWFAWPDGPTTKNEQCSPAARMQIFRSKSKKGRRGNFFQKEGCLFGKLGSFSSRQGIFFQQGLKIVQKGPLFAHVYEPLVRETGNLALRRTQEPLQPKKRSRIEWQPCDSWTTQIRELNDDKNMKQGFFTIFMAPSLFFSFLSINKNTLRNC